MVKKRRKLLRVGAMGNQQGSYDDAIYNKKEVKVLIRYDWENKREELEYLYFVQKMTILDIAKHYGCQPKTVSEAMKRLNMPKATIGDDQRKNALYAVDSIFFNQIDTEEKAYVLGLAASDGHVSKNNVLMFSFQVDDAHILNDIKRVMKSEHPIGTKHHGNSKTLNIGSKTLCSQLRDIGLNNNKSLWFDWYRVVDHIPPHLLHHFVRGFFDGDGSIKYYHYNYHKKHSFHFGITSIYEVSLFMRDYFDLGTKMVDEGNGIWTCVSTNHAKILAAEEILYKNATMFLERKRKTFAEIRAICRKEYESS